VDGQAIGEIERSSIGLSWIRPFTLFEDSSLVVLG